MYYRQGWYCEGIRAQQLHVRRASGVENGVFGMAMNLEEDNIGCVLFRGERDVKEGTLVKRTGKTVEVLWEILLSEG